MGYQWECK